MSPRRPDCRTSLIRSVEIRLVSNANQHLGEAALLLIVETCKKRLGGIGELLLIDGMLGHGIGSPAHLVDDVDGALLLRAVGAQRGVALRLLLADIAHRAFEAGPVVLLLRCKAQVSPD